MCGKETNKRNILSERIQLLSRGILPPIFEGRSLSNLASIGVGAGPQGKTYHIISPQTKKTISMISIPVFPEDHHLAKFAFKTKLGSMPGTLIVENGIILKSSLPPKFLNKKMNNGIAVAKRGIAMVHCYNTCTTVLGYDCKHFSEGNECRYCEIVPVGKDAIGFSEKQSIDEFVEVIKIATSEDKIRSLTITSGTFDEPDKVAEYYLKLLKILKSEVNITVHIQIEPLKDLNLLKLLSEYSDSIGIFLEVFNEQKRKEICPGKSKISLDDYIINWKEAVKFFGKGNILTTCLLGFGVDYEEILKKIDSFAKIGVRTSLLFVRSKSIHLKKFIPSYLNKDLDELVDLHINAAKIMANYGILFKKGIDSGCIGCQGCTAMTEAFELIS
jgi:biotin synthase-related radical SAM superfamily protein